MIAFVHSHRHKQYNTQLTKSEKYFETPTIGFARCFSIPYEFCWYCLSLAKIVCRQICVSLAFVLSFASCSQKQLQVLSFRF